MKEILKNNRLTIFEDKVVVNKRLPKWQRAEFGLEKTKVPETSQTLTGTNDLRAYLVTPADNDPDASLNLNRQITDIDSDVGVSTQWLPLYEVAEGVSFNELATAGIKDLTRMIAENKLKFVIGGYGSFGHTQSSNTIVLSNNYDTVVSSYNQQMQQVMEKKNRTFIQKFREFFKKEVKAEDNVKYIDALEFFSLVKLSSKESVATYRDRVSDYLSAVHNAVTVGQTALMEDLLRGLVTNKYESVLFAEGLYYVVTEEQMVSFVKQCEKGIKLDYIKNFTRPLPQDVVSKIERINQLEVFDNYVVLYYDPEGKIYKETAREEAKRKDPIVFGVIAGSTKLYYIADWVDEYCDLTLEKFIDTIGVKQEELHMDYPNNVANNNSAQIDDNQKLPKKKRKYKKRTKKDKKIN
jgi:hypothetical protein